MSSALKESNVKSKNEVVPSTKEWLKDWSWKYLEMEGGVSILGREVSYILVRLA
jgi:hypothetical protein